MKKRKGVSIPKSLRQQTTSYSTPAIIRQARDYPLVGCWISAGWQKDKVGLTKVIVAHQQPDDNICFGVYLIDRYCLGVKDTYARANFSPARYQQEVQGIFRETGPQACSPELAYQMIYESIDYAARFGFSPNKDFELSQYLLAPRGTFKASYKLEFGQKGKPLFIAGPYDDATAILKQLDKTAGPGNYHYVVGPPPGMF
jgi:hypothetical protein